MASTANFLLFFSFAALSLATISASEGAAAAESKEYVLTLDHSNFSDTVSKHDFVVVEFYAPWCGHCKKLAPEYEKAASTLHSHDPSIVLAKVDASEESNREFASLYDIKGFPTLKILRNGGKVVQEYKGPRDAEGIATYVKKQSGPASVEIKSAEDATNLIGENKVVIVGVFFKFSGEEYENFTALAEKLRSDYEFGYTLDAKHLPRGESSVPGPVVWLFKPFDELTVDFQAMFFVNFSSEFDAHKKKYSEVAKEYKGKGISFLLGDIEASEGAFQYFGVKEEQVPLVIIQTDDQKKYIKSNVEPEQIATWIKDFKEGKVSLHKKSEPIPQTND